MKITAIKAWANAILLPRPFHGSNYVYTHKKALYLRIGTNAGLEGCCYLGDDFGLGAEIVAKIERDFSPALIGEDPTAVQAHWQNMRAFCRDILGDRRVALHAQALIDIGLWDLVGKAKALPLAAVFGEARTDCPVIAIAGYYAPGKTLQDLADEVRVLKKLGCAGVKLKVGGLSLDDDIARVRAVRSAGGSDFLLAVDANQAWSLDETRVFLDGTAAENLYWLEEPVHWDNDLEDLATLHAECDVPICAGQSEWTVAGAKRLIDAKAIDICNIHPGYAGGVTPWLAVAQYAATHGVSMANTGEPQLSAQLIPGLPHGTCVEIYHPDRDPLFPAHCPIAAAIEGGRIGTSRASGWGIMLPAV